MKIYAGGQTGAVAIKTDDSPLTLADQAAHEHIVAALRSLTPEIPVISEESQEKLPADFQQWPQFWLVDPLDGTKEFIKKSGSFTVNIALIKGREPVLGVVHAPAMGLTYFAERDGGAWRTEEDGSPVSVSVRKSNPSRLCVVASKDHAGPEVAAMLERIPGAELASMGSSLKFCLVAEGKADLYPRFVPTMEWDTAAAQCIVETAGGAVLDLDGNPLRYQKVPLKNPSIITVGDAALGWKQFLG